MALFVYPPVQAVLTGAATEVTLSAVATDVQALVNKLPAGLVPEAFDELVIGYIGSTTDISSVTYKLASVTVAVLTLSYDGQNRLNGVVKT